MGNTPGQAAGGITREIAVEVTAIRKVTAALLKTLHIDDGNTYHSARELPGFQFIHDPAHDLDTVEFIAVDSGGEAEYRPGIGTVDHQYRRWLGQSGDLYVRGPGQTGGSAR